MTRRSLSLTCRTGSCIESWLQEKLEKQRAIYVEKMKNAVAVAHRAAQEMRAATEARKAEEIVRANDIASRIRATGQVPRKFLCLHA